MKLFIYGVSGSGKSFLAKKISKKCNVDYLDLDDIFWKDKYNFKNTDKYFTKLLSNFIKNNKSWVMEGVFTKNVDKAVKECDKVIFLDLDKNVLTFRLIKRYFLGLFKKNESIKNTVEMIKCARSYKNEGSHFYKQLKVVDKYNKSYLVLKTAKDVESFLKSL